MWNTIGEITIGAATATLLFLIRELWINQKRMSKENEQLREKNKALKDELAAWRRAAAEFDLTEDGKTLRRPEIPLSQQWDNLGRYNGRPQKREEEG